MGKNIVPIVKSQIPEFVKSDHPQFSAFIDAYYEYLEKTSDSESSSVKDLFRKNPNPGALIANAEEHRDLYTSIQTFLDYFAKDLVPFNISGNYVTDAFLLNKIRDLYVAKGTPDSFKLLFRLLYGEEIDVLEPRSRIIEASEGLYVQFAQMKAVVTAGEEELIDFNFELSTISLDTSLDSDISDSDGTEILTVVDATYDGTTQENQVVLNLILTAVPDSGSKLNYGDEYNLRDANDLQKEVRIKAISHITSVNITNSGAGHRVGDLFTVKDNFSSVKVSVDQISSGPIEKVLVRERGNDYQVGDTIEFVNEESSDGTGAIASITAVDEYGAILEIDGIRLRTGTTHQGYLADDFQPVAVPILQGGLYKSIPSPLIRTTTGEGAQIDGWSANVGKIISISNRETGFFDSENNGEITVEKPFTTQLSNVEDDVPLGSYIEFQYFDGNEENRSFKDDSELLVVNFFRGYNADNLRENETQYITFSENGPWTFTNSIVNDSEKLIEDDSDSFQWKTFYSGGDPRGQAYFKFPISYDSDNFVFNYRTIKITDSDRDSDIIDKWVSDSEFNLRRVTYTYATGDSEGHKVRKFPVYIEDSEIYRLDDYHWSKVKQNNSLKSSNSIITRDGNNSVIGVQQYKIAELVYTTEKRLSIIEADSDGLYRSVGEWKGTGMGGIISSKSSDNRNLTIQKRSGVKSSGDSDLIFPTIENLDTYANADYGILRVARINPVSGTILTPETFPISNVVVNYALPSVSINTSVASNTEKRFLDESGFLSSVSGGVLRDNFTISEFAYILQTNTPMREWRGKVKETLHPAGLYLFGELNVNSEYDAAVTDTAVQENFIEYEKGRMTFSDEDDYYDDEEREGIAVLADTSVFESNPYNAVSYTNNASGVYLTADYTQQVVKNSIRSQKGNSYFDYEPVGLVHRTWDGFDSEKAYVAVRNLVAAGDTEATRKYGHLFTTRAGIIEPNYNAIPFFEYTSEQTTQQFDSDVPEHRSIYIADTSSSIRVTSDNAKYVSQSLRLVDSDSMRIRMPDWLGRDSDFTIECFIRIDSDSPSEGFVFGITDSDENTYSHTLKLSDFDSDITVGEWHHLAYVKSGAKDFYLLNGQVYTGGTGYSDTLVNTIKEPGPSDSDFYGKYLSVSRATDSGLLPDTNTYATIKLKRPTSTNGWTDSDSEQFKNERWDVWSEFAEVTYPTNSAGEIAYRVVWENKEIYHESDGNAYQGFTTRWKPITTDIHSAQGSLAEDGTRYYLPLDMKLKDHFRKLSFGFGTSAVRTYFFPLRREKQVYQQSLVIGNGFKGLVSNIHISKTARYDSDSVIDYSRSKPDNDTIALLNFDVNTGTLDSDNYIVQPLKRGIKNKSLTYSPNYGLSSRIDGQHNEIGIAQVYFEDFAQYRAYDSEVPTDVFSRFDAINTGMKAIDYTRLYDSRGDSDLMFKFPAIRKMDILIDKQKDLNKALRLNQDFVYKANNQTYYDLEAYEMKYNNFTSNRDSDITDGYVIPGKITNRLNVSQTIESNDSDSELNNGDTKYRLTRKLDIENDRSYEKTPRTSAAYGKYGDSDRESTIVVRQSFLREINNSVQYIDRDSDFIDHLDRKRTK